jgi:glycerophosphoryl diester phosphodiesterase
LKIADGTLDELRALELPPYLGVPQHIPTLEEVLAIVPEDKLALIELKADREKDPQLGRSVGKLLRTLPHAERFFVHSFDPTSLHSFHRAFGEVPTALLIARRPHFDGPTDPAEAPRARKKVNALALHPELALMTPANVQLWQEERVSVWTVDDPEEAKSLAALGVNGIITNDPRRIREAVREATGR